MEIRLGLQTITWGDPQDTIMEEILTTAKECGYDGVEIGWRRVAPVGSGRLAGLLKKQGLEFFGTHAGGNLEDSAQADDERRQIDVILDGLGELDGSFLLYSGLRYETKEQLALDIASLNSVAEKCAAEGKRLLYHNHDWEFDSGAAAWNALLNESVPELGFCPDVGWISKAGENCLARLDGIRERIEAVHFKDFLTARPGEKDVCGLGEGTVPLREIAAWVGELPADEFWVISEQDTCTGSPEDAVKMNAVFMLDCFGR